MDNDVVRQAPLFSALDDEAATALRSSMAETKLRRGDVLFHEGDSGDKLYIVLDGKVKLGRTSSDGRENLLAILGPGQMFGELSLFDPGPRSATVTAVTDTTFASLSHEDLLRWLEGRPMVARGLLAQIAGRLRKANDVDRRPGLLRRARAGWPRRCSTSPTASAAPPTTASTSTTTSPRRSSPSSSAPPARRSTRRWPTSRRAGWLRLEPRSVVIMDIDRLPRRAR